jgi:RecA-family ATPase
LGIATEESRVLHVNLECDPAEFVRRLHQVAKARGLKPDSERVDLLHLMGTEKNIGELADLIVKRVESAMKWDQREYSLVVIDGLGRHLPHREGVLTTAGDPVSTVLSLDRIAARTDSAVVAFLRAEEGKRLEGSVDGWIHLYEEPGEGMRLQTRSEHFAPLGPVALEFTTGRLLRRK